MNIITKMEISKRNKERINIYIDEEYAFSISAELVYKENLKVKDKVDVQLLKKLSDEDNYIKCKNTALKIIERTYKSEKELAERLEKIGYNVTISTELSEKKSQEFNAILPITSNNENAVSIKRYIFDIRT